MRHKGVPKEETRQKVVEAAGRSFRKHGYAGIGVNGLAEAAGVTSGAIYSHFGSKDGAFSVALAAGLDEVIEGVPEFRRQHGSDWVKAFVDYYLSKSHRNDLETGCAMATLTAEVVRFGADVHAIYEKKMTAVADVVSKGLAGGSDDELRARAWSMLGILIGGLNVTRAMKSARASEEVAKAIKATAVKAAGRTRSSVPD